MTTRISSRLKPLVLVASLTAPAVPAPLSGFAVATAAASFLAAEDAQARAGRGRSFGRSARPQRNAQPRQQQRPDAPQNAQPSNKGGLLRGLGAGIAGGILGSMLFRSLGLGEGGGGIMLLVLLAGLGFLAYRFYRQRQLTTSFANIGGSSWPATPRANSYDLSQETMSNSAAPVQSHTAPAEVTIDSGTAQDIFFRVQGAWTRRDLTPLKSILGDEVYTTLDQELDALRQAAQVNRLENIAIRATEVLQSWREGDTDVSAVRFTANLLDYTIDEATGRLLDGDDSTPVKFDEIWVFRRHPMLGTWTLEGIEQA